MRRSQHARWRLPGLQCSLQRLPAAAACLIC